MKFPACAKFPAFPASQISHITKYIGSHICFDINAEIRRKKMAEAAKSK